MQHQPDTRNVQPTTVVIILVILMLVIGSVVGLAVKHNHDVAARREHDTAERCLGLAVTAYNNGGAILPEECYP